MTARRRTCLAAAVTSGLATAALFVYLHASSHGYDVGARPRRNALRPSPSMIWSNRAPARSPVPSRCMHRSTMSGRG